MWQRVKLILSNKSVMKRLGITILFLLLFRFLTYVTVPFLNGDINSLWTSISEGGFLDILNNYSGDALQRFSILALGISPYITASIVVQLLQMVIPSLKEWGEQGESGKLKTNRLTRILGIVLGFLQALLLFIPQKAILHPYINDVSAILVIGLVITAGTAFCIWMADMITKKGIGNGTSMLIAAGIVVSIPKMFTTVFYYYQGGGNVASYFSSPGNAWSWILMILMYLLYFGILFAVVYLEAAVRKIPVQYANRQGKTDSNIPIKLNSGGVIPVIFASTLLSIPLTVFGFLNPDGGGKWIDIIFNYQKPIGFIIYLVLIAMFSFFYSFMQIDPDKIADNLSKSNAYVPGVKPGEDTKKYVARLLFKVTIVGTIYLIVLAALPILIPVIFGLPSTISSVISIGGTSLMIIVGVAIETTKQMEADASQAQYQGVF